MRRRTLAFITLILCAVISFAQNNSIWRNFDKNSVEKESTSFTRINTSTPQQNPQNKSSLNKVLNNSYAPYKFSGGDGSAETPFEIATPQDLVDMSKAVNSKATYRRNGSNTNLNYYAANYIMTADIDMSEPISGPFIMCEKTIKNNNNWTVNYEQIIQQSTSQTAPYTCPRVYLDNATGDISLASKTDTISRNYTSGNYTYYFKYYFYKESDMTYSALFSPIGTLAIQDDQRHLDQNNCVNFSGNFDGKGHYINNLEIIVESTAAGLFGYVSNAYTGGNAANTVIQNVNLDNITVSNASQTYSGGIAGSLSIAYIKNCSVTNSNITGGYAGGGIVGRMVYPGSGSTSNGYVQNCKSYHNTVTAQNAGGIVGSNVDGVGRVNDNIVSGNTINGTSTGSVVPGVNIDDPEIDNNGNINYENIHVTITSLKNELMMEGKIPDYCYINAGISFDPQNSISDKNKLERLAKELNGQEPITQNIVLPNMTAVDNIVSTWRDNMENDLLDAYAQNVIFTNTYNASARNTTNEMKAIADGGAGNFYTYNTGVWTRMSPNSSNDYNKICGYSITIDGQEHYYRYFCVRGGSIGNRTYTWYFTDVENTTIASNNNSLASDDHRFLYYYKGWVDYDESMKEKYIADYTAKLDKQAQYYRLTAPGTSANPIIVDITAGGGLFDKGGQLGNKVVQFRKRLQLQDWNLIGILPVNMTGSFAGVTFNNKINFLYNTDNSAASNASAKTKHNDMAVVGFDYSANDWSSNYMLYSQQLEYSKGIFVWPYNTEWADFGENDPNYTPIFTNNPVLVQQGTIQEYFTDNTLSTSANTYVQSLRNTSTTTPYWFSLANPFTGNMNVNNLIKNLTNNDPSLVTGEQAYVYRTNSLGVQQWFPYLAKGSNNISAGDGFMIALANKRTFNEIDGSNFGVNSMFGYYYNPAPASKSTSNQSTSNNVDNHSFEFLFIDDMKNVSRLSAKCRDEAIDGLDRYDGIAMLSRDITMPYFVVEGEKVNNDNFFTLPYEVPMNIHANKDGKIQISLVCPQKENLFAEVIDTENDNVTTVLNGASHVFLDVREGENEGRYKVRFYKHRNVGEETIQAPIANIDIWNDNKEINIYGKDLKEVEVVNTLGQRIYERKISGESFRFDLNTIAGAYIVRVKNSEGIKIEKIIIN
ncbi:MAG: T9SS type A sorting domain-containing protein [Bacteroidales bacterium]|nr:T9SS type A sorting domain-containing protein [Bacteroidales bacterium]